MLVGCVHKLAVFPGMRPGNEASAYLYFIFFYARVFNNCHSFCVNFH